MRLNPATPARKIRTLACAAVAATALTAAVAAQSDAGSGAASVTVPNLAGRPRTEAEALLAQRGLRYKARRPSSRYELPKGVLGIGDALTAVPEEQSPDRLVTGQDPPAGLHVPPGYRVEFSTSPRPPGNNRRPLPIEIANTSLASDGRSLTVGLASGQYVGSCRPFDHLDVAPRDRYVLVTPYVNLTDGLGPCSERRRAVSLVLRRTTGGKPIVERVPVPPLEDLFNVYSVPWQRVRLESAGHYAVTYFQAYSGCATYSHATVTPRGQKAALTIYTGTVGENPSFCGVFRPRFLALVRIPDPLVGRPIVDGSEAG